MTLSRMDPRSRTFQAHQAVARVIGLAAMMLTDTELLPFNPVRYHQALTNLLNLTKSAAPENINFSEFRRLGTPLFSVNAMFQLRYNTPSINSKPTLSSSTDACRPLWTNPSEYTKHAEPHRSAGWHFSPMELRTVNDQLMQLERAFLNPLGNSVEQSDLK